jgi:putative phosphoserine phosphatase / 1-acylglycerol-3-phosphate O-acyltransferase
VPHIWNVTSPPLVRVRVGAPVALEYDDIRADTERIMSAIVDLLPAEAREQRAPTEEELRRSKPS